MRIKTFVLTISPKGTSESKSAISPDEADKIINDFCTEHNVKHISSDILISYFAGSYTSRYTLFYTE